MRTGAIGYHRIMLAGNLVRARRSCLSVPAVLPAMLAGARELIPDEVVLDLEDSVPPDAKDGARAAVVAACARTSGGRARSACGSTAPGRAGSTTTCGSWSPERASGSVPRRPEGRARRGRRVRRRPGGRAGAGAWPGAPGRARALIETATGLHSAGDRPCERAHRGLIVASRTSPLRSAARRSRRGRTRAIAGDRYATPCSSPRATRGSRRSTARPSTSATPRAARGGRLRALARL